MTGRGGAHRGLGALLALASWCAAGVARADDGSLIIETGSPDALCPELASTRAAVSRRLGELIMPGGSSAFRARYTIAHAPVGSPRDFVRLELYGPEGTLRLSRDLPLERDSCSTMAEVIALVLDRYFRQLPAHDGAGADDEDEELPAESREAALTSPAASALASAARKPNLQGTSSDELSPSPVRSGTLPSDSGPSEEPASMAPTPHRSEPLLVGALEIGMRSLDRPSLGLRGVLEPWPQAYVGTSLHVALRSQTQALAGAGEVSSHDASWRVNAGWGPRLGPVRTYLGPAISLDVARGSGEGLERQKSGLRATWAAGVELGGLWVTSDDWSFGAAAALDVSVLSGRFEVDEREVLALERVRGWFGISVGHAF